MGTHAYDCGCYDCRITLPDTPLTVPDLTTSLRQARRGDTEALNALFPLVYDELRRLARNLMRRERPTHTLQTTGLVHEAYVRLADQRSLDPADRSFFLGLAATMMRRVLVNHARDRAADKRGDGLPALSLSAAAEVPMHDEFDVLGLHACLEALERLDARQARVVELRFFGGLELDEIASLLAVSVATVKRDWTMARLWLARELRA